MSNLEIVYDCIGLPTKNHFKKTRQIDGCLLRSNGNIVKSAIHTRGYGDFQVTQQLFTPPSQTIDNTAYYGGIYFNHFGHFIIESMARLWFYKVVNNSGYDIFFHKRNMLNEEKMPGWMIEILELLEIKKKKIYFIKNTINFKEIIIPSQVIGTNRLKPSLEFTNGIVQIIEKNIADFKINFPNSLESLDKVYVSRSQLAITKGRIAGESEFESILEKNNFLIFHPQEHSIKTQLQLYKNAKNIIFSEGSAAHLCILIDNMQANVMILNRRKNCKMFHRQFKNFGVNCTQLDFVRGNLSLKEDMVAGANSLGILNYTNLLEYLHKNDSIDNYKQFQTTLYNSVGNDVIEYLDKISSKSPHKFLISSKSFKETIESIKPCFGNSFKRVNEKLNSLIDNNKLAGV